MRSRIMMPVPLARSGAQRRHCAGVELGRPQVLHTGWVPHRRRHLAFVAHVGGHRPLHSSQAGLAERLDEVAALGSASIWSHPSMACIR